MQDSQAGMPGQHSGAREAHYFLDLFPSIRLVAVNGALGARWLGLLIRTSLKALEGVPEKPAAIVT